MGSRREAKRKSRCRIISRQGMKERHSTGGGRKWCRIMAQHRVFVPCSTIVKQFFSRTKAGRYIGRCAKRGIGK